jgi:hypothetical protein
MVKFVEEVDVEVMKAYKATELFQNHGNCESE